MELKDIRVLMEEIGVEGDKIDEFIYSLEREKKDGKVEDEVPALSEVDLKIALSAEPDWRKRAALAARIISNNLGDPGI